VGSHVVITAVLSAALAGLAPALAVVTATVLAVHIGCDVAWDQYRGSGRGDRPAERTQQQDGENRNHQQSADDEGKPVDDGSVESASSGGGPSGMSVTSDGVTCKNPAIRGPGPALLVEALAGLLVGLPEFDVVGDRLLSEGSVQFRLHLGG